MPMHTLPFRIPARQIRRGGPIAALTLVLLCGLFGMHVLPTPAMLHPMGMPHGTVAMASPHHAMAGQSERSDAMGVDVLAPSDVNGCGCNAWGHVGAQCQSPAPTQFHATPPVLPPSVGDPAGVTLPGGRCTADGTVAGRSPPSLAALQVLRI
jgi:hypothetical protein